MRCAICRREQVLFLTHHDHLLPLVRDVFGARVNVVGSSAHRWARDAGHA